MGLLDEAIREHLDLKRRHGADPAEIERAEHEALGPARRMPDDDQLDPEAVDHDSEDELDLAPGAEPEAAPELEYVDEEEGPWEEPFDQETEIFSPEDRLEHAEEALPAEEHPGGLDAPAIPPPHQAPDPSPRQSGGHADEETAILPPEQPPTEHASQENPPPGQPPSDHVSQETEEYDVELRHGEGDAMLEETPEFLQDTPEHDRLWFEQRPPRDFDFDG